MASLRPTAIPKTVGGLSAKGVRHLFGIKDLSPAEFISAVRQASALKTMFSSPGQSRRAERDLLQGRTVAMVFNKLSTRTRVSTEVAVNLFGGHPMFLGKNDIQLGTNETVRDTAQVLSEMVAAIFARVHEHSEIEALAEHSSVPVINALSTDHHPLQAIADFQTLCEVLAPTHVSANSLSLEGKRVAWVGDANNVLYDLASGCLMSGMDIAVATPPGYEIPEHMRAIIKGCAKGADSPGALFETNVPEEAVRHADVIVTDTWTSMGFEDETAKRLAAFEGFQVTEELAKRGMAKKDWKFLHCLPRHKEEVDDEVFYGPRSCVWAEAQNRVWAAMSILQAFVGSKGHFRIPAQTEAIKHGLLLPSGTAKSFP